MRIAGGRQAGGTAGLPPAPEIAGAFRHLRFVPKPDSCGAAKNPISLRSRPSYRRIKLDQWQSSVEQLLRRQHVRGVKPFGKPVVNGLKYLGGTGSIFLTNP
jgi:hypothetical protein